MPRVVGEARKSENLNLGSAKSGRMRMSQVRRGGGLSAHPVRPGNDTEYAWYIDGHRD